MTKKPPTMPHLRRARGDTKPEDRPTPPESVSAHYRRITREVKSVDSKRRRAVVGLGSAILIAATPGVYSSWQTAREAYRAQREQRVHDVSTKDLQANLGALAQQLTALEASCVSHKDLVDVVLKIKGLQKPPPPRGRTSRTRARTSRSLRALEHELAVIKRKATTAAQVRAQAQAAKKIAPKLKAPETIRQMVEQAEGAAD